MTDDTHILGFLDKRVNFLIAFKKVLDKKAEFKCMEPLFKRLEADWERGVVPVEDNKRAYAYCKNPNDFKTMISTKLGKIIRKLYKEEAPLKDHIISDFVSMVNAIVWREPPTIIIYKGKDIITAYDSMKGHGALDTCMVKEERPQTLLDILTENPDVVELHCLEDADDMKARALVWTAPNGDRIVDRIYPNSGEFFQQFKAYYETKPNYYIRRNHQQPDDGTNIDKIGITKQPNPIMIEVKNVSMYPYLDTFHYGYKKDENTLILTNVLNDYCSMKYENIDGSYKSI